MIKTYWISVEVSRFLKYLALHSSIPSVLVQVFDAQHFLFHLLLVFKNVLFLCGLFLLKHYMCQ